MKKQYCIDGFLCKSEENYGYLKQAMEHALTLGVKHSDMIYRMLTPNTWYTPRYLFIFRAGERKEYWYMTVADKKETWWQTGMHELSVAEFLEVTELEEPNGKLE